MNPLDRLPRESAPAYAAFLEYLRLGPERSAAAVGKKLGKSSTICERWSARNSWLRRAAAFDVAEAKRQGEADDRAKDKAAVTLAEQRLKVQASAWGWYEKLKSKAEEMLAFPVFKRTITDRHDDGKERITVVEPLNWRMSDIARLIEVGDALGRLAAGMPQKVTAISDPDGKPFSGPPVDGAGALPVVIYFTDNENTRSAVAQFGARPARNGDAAAGAVGPVDGS